MNAALGRSGVLLAFAAAVVGIVVVLVGLFRNRPALVRSGRTYAWLVFAGAAAATIAMEHAFLTHDFRLAYVAQNNSRQTPLLYDITGMWSALQGSLLLWGLVLAGYLVAMVTHFRRRLTDPLVGWATVVMLAVSAFFFGLMVGPATPFATVKGVPPVNGPGPDPLLQQRALVAFHPPLLYLGFVGFTVPFAFAIASLVTGRLREGWLREMRSWTLFAWGCLGFGIVLGAWWSYQVLGWGGFWAWDPVENAAFLPWLTGTAYLHSAVAQERRGLLRVWNLSLIIATFSLTILGTFLTRSGDVQSVHAFSDSNLGDVLMAFFLVVVLSGVGLIAWRGDKLRAPGRVETLWSREGAFLANNIAFAAFAFVVLLGTVFPLFVQALQGYQVSVGAPYFDTVTTPIALALLFLMAIGPALPWRRANGEAALKRLYWPAWAATATVVGCVVAGVRGISLLVAFGLAAFAAASAARSLWRTTRAALAAGRGPLSAAGSRSNGGMVVHLGVAIIAVALVAATHYGQRGQVTLRRGQSATFDGHRITYLGTRTVVTPSETSDEAIVRVDRSRILYPGVSQFGTSTEAVGSPAIDSGARDDVYLTFVGPPGKAGGAATIGVIVQPLVAWLWIGGGVMAAGTLLALFPRRRRRPQPLDGAGPTAARGAAEPPAPTPAMAAAGGGSPA